MLGAKMINRLDNSGRGLGDFAGATGAKATISASLAKIVAKLRAKPYRLELCLANSQHRPAGWIIVELIASPAAKVVNITEMQLTDGLTRYGSCETNISVIPLNVAPCSEPLDNGTRIAAPAGNKNDADFPECAGTIYRRLQVADQLWTDPNLFGFICSAALEAKQGNDQRLDSGILIQQDCILAKKGI